MVQTLTAWARQGHPEAADSVLRWLAALPELRAAVRELDAVSAKAEDAWARAAGFGEPLVKRAARDEAAVLRSQLLGAAPSTVERMLATA